MKEQSTIDHRINQYLDAVREQLAGLSQHEVDSIVDDLREHIDSALQAQGDQPSLKSVENVLAEMDPPESFALALDEPADIVPKISRAAIIGAVFLPFGLVMAILFLLPVSFATFSEIDGVAVESMPQTAWWQWLLRFTVLPLGILSPFVTTISGLVAMSQIRASKGKLVGKPLALIDALFYPLLLLDGLVLALLFAIIASIPEGNLALTETMAMLGYLAVIILDVVVVAIAWARLR